MQSLHPRVAVSGLCLPTLSAADAVGVIAGLGVTKTSMTSAKIKEAGLDSVDAACRRHGVQMVTTTALARFDLSPGADEQDSVARACADLDAAAQLGASSVYTLTGRRAFPEWAANVEAYAEQVRPVLDHAARLGLHLAVEPTSWLYADLNFVHTFHDAIAFARRTGLKVCLDVFHVWTERELREEIVENIDLISHVQLSDMHPAARALPCRAVPGDGEVPLTDIVRWLLDAGYQGVFDLELSGPAVDLIGHRDAAERSATWLSALLTEHGV